MQKGFLCLSVYTGKILVEMPIVGVQAEKILTLVANDVLLVFAFVKVYVKGVDVDACVYDALHKRFVLIE